MHPIAAQYAGLALSEREENLYHDSYFWLTVWNPDEEKPDYFTYAATAYLSNPMHPNTVRDLLTITSESVRAAYVLWEQRNRKYAALQTILMGFERGDAFVGDTVEVYKGRKVPKGTRGRVATISTRTTHVSRYGTWKTEEDFAFIITETGASWIVNADHLKVLNRGPILQMIMDLAE